MQKYSLKTILAALVLSQIVSASTPPAPRVRDYASTFSKFWSAAKTLSPELQLAQFKNEVVPAFPEFYAYKFESWKQRGMDSDKRIKDHLRNFPAIEAQFAAKTESIAAEIAHSLPAFLNVFDDLDTDFDISLVHSLGEMDGGTRYLNGQLRLIFGIDSIVKYHKGLASDVPFFHHELFHVYHSAKAPPQTDELWNYLWMEGLATYVSQVLNPGATYADIMLDQPSGLVSRCELDMNALLQILNEKLESTERSDYELLFMFSSTDPRVPARAGYYLGYLIAQEAAKAHSLKELAQLTGPPLLAEIRAILATLQMRTLERTSSQLLADERRL